MTNINNIYIIYIDIYWRESTTVLKPCHVNLHCYGVSHDWTKARVKNVMPFLLCFFLSQAASIAPTEEVITIDSMEAVEGALNDSWDQLDSGKPAFR